MTEITTNRAAASDPASFLIDVSTPEGKATGLDQNSNVVESQVVKKWQDEAERKAIATTLLQVRAAGFTL
jgi:hypothetical protein